MVYVQERMIFTYDSALQWDSTTDYTEYTHIDHWQACPHKRCVSVPVNSVFKSIASSLFRNVVWNDYANSVTLDGMKSLALVYVIYISFLRPIALKLLVYIIFRSREIIANPVEFHFNALQTIIVIFISRPIYSSSALPVLEATAPHATQQNDWNAGRRFRCLLQFVYTVGCDMLEVQQL